MRTKLGQQEINDTICMHGHKLRQIRRRHVTTPSGVLGLVNGGLITASSAPQHSPGKPHDTRTRRKSWLLLPCGARPAGTPGDTTTTTTTPTTTTTTTTTYVLRLLLLLLHEGLLSLPLLPLLLLVLLVLLLIVLLLLGRPDTKHKLTLLLLLLLLLLRTTYCCCCFVLGRPGTERKLNPYIYVYHIRT